MKTNAKRKFANLRERYYLSESGLLTLKSKLQDLYAKRAEHLGRIRELKEEQSDNLFIEDSAYIQTMSSMQFLESESQRLETVLANAEVVGTAKRPRRVRLGSHVLLETGSKERREYTIVDSVEADPFSGKISDESPLGQQLLGKHLDDKVVINGSPKLNRRPLELRLVNIR